MIIKLLLALFATLLPAAQPPTTGKSVQIRCTGDVVSASAVGVYGGVSFAVSCHRGRSKAQQINPSGTVWSARVGAETAGAAYDCAFSGDAETVSESCQGGHLTID